ncbi:MAG: PAS domain S-box protein [Gallionellaceae bacterium]|nr:PAS domain S-box protein [Gallionellaceae bacterium]
MRLPAAFKDASIRGKLMFTAFVATVAATLFAMLALTAQQWFQQRNALERNVYAQASIVAANSTAALAFNDREAAEQTLDALAVIDNIEFAELFGKDGQDLAAYVRPGSAMPPHRHHGAEGMGNIYTMTHFEIVLPVVLKQERLGSLHVRSSMAPVYEALAWSLLMIVVASTGALLVAVTLVLRLLPAITDPLQYLVGLMSTVSREKNYGLRAELTGKDEVGTLAQGFNDMLVQIQIQDDELAQQRQQLEEKVVQRTAELRQTNSLLEQELVQRRQAEERISESEARYRGIFEYADDIIYLLTPEGNIHSLNPAFEHLTGWPAEEWLGKPFMPIVHPDDQPRAAEIFRNTLAGQSTPVFELRLARKSGGYFDSELSIVPVGPGSKIAAIGIARDVTERKRAEEEIRRQQELTSLIIETIPMRVFWKDRDLRYLGCNTLFAHDAGMADPDTMIGKTDFDMGWQDRAELYRADDRRVMDTNNPTLSYDEPQTTPDGGRIWLRTSKVPLRNEAHETIGVMGVYEDITESKLAAQALEESELRFRTILESAVDGILVADGHTHQFVIANQAVCAMLGYTQEELYRLSMEDIHPAEALPNVRQQFERQLKGEIRVALNLPVQRKDGSVFFADVSASPMTLSGHPFLAGIFHDVTERRQAEEKVRRLNEELEEKVQERTRQLLAAQEDLVRKEKLAVLGQVAGSVGHELRNPLGVMNNAVYFLQTVLSEADATTQEYLVLIKTEIATAERIVSDLLDSVRTKPPQAGTVWLAELIGQTLRKLPVPDGVTVEQAIPATLPPLRVDPQQVQQVLRNLISNGIDAMAEGGTLTITAAADGMSVAVSVRDTGSGIAPEQMARLFQPLYTTKARGIGLGLVVVKNLTEANGGRIEVQSEPGRGTVFTVTLPCAGPAEEAT